MPKVTTDEQDGASPIEAAVQNALSTIVMTSNPVVIIGVNRKINTGNFENIDVYAGVALPTYGVSTEDMDSLKAELERIADLGFAIASEETGKRYVTIKKMLEDQKKS